MMKLFALAVALAAAGYAIPAYAGGCCGGSSAKSSPDGFSCSNPCPLAQQANNRRSHGSEALGASAIVRAPLAAAVQRNLSRM